MQICLTLPFSLKARAFLVHYSEKAFIELTFALFPLLFLNAIKTIVMLITYSWGFVIRLRLIFDLKVLQSNEKYQQDFRAGRKYFKYFFPSFCFQNVFLQMNVPFILGLVEWKYHGSNYLTASYLALIHDFHIAPPLEQRLYKRFYLRTGWRYKNVPYLIVIYKTQILVQTILSCEISMTNSSGINF